MAEHIETRYRRLFEIRLLHHYWLDQDGTVFDAMAPDPVPSPQPALLPTRQERRLLTYDIRPVLDLAPTASTQALLRRLGAVYKSTALGGIVAVPEDFQVAHDAVFHFIITVRKAQFFAYTALTWMRQRVVERFDPASRRVYRVKEGAFDFSNATGTLLGTELYLSRPVSDWPPPAPPAGQPYRVEALFRNGTRLVQLTDELGSSANVYGATDFNALPAFVTQNDVPAVDLPAALAAEPLDGVLLSADLPDDLFARIEIRAEVARPEFCLFAAAASPPETLAEPVFRLHFKNRSTRWVYRSKSNAAVVLAGEGPFPLTYFSDNSAVPNRARPGPDTPLKAEYDHAVPPRLTALVSEIFD